MSKARWRTCLTFLGRHQSVYIQDPCLVGRSFHFIPVFLKFGRLAWFRHNRNWETHFSVWIQHTAGAYDSAVRFLRGRPDNLEHTLLLMSNQLPASGMRGTHAQDPRPSLAPSQASVSFQSQSLEPAVPDRPVTESLPSRPRPGLGDTFPSHSVKAQGSSGLNQMIQSSKEPRGSALCLRLPFSLHSSTNNSFKNYFIEV